MNINNVYISLNDVNTNHITYYKSTCNDINLCLYMFTYKL